MLLSSHRWRMPLTFNWGNRWVARSHRAFPFLKTPTYIPYPQMVVMKAGLVGSSSIFTRSRRMLTSTIFTSPR